MSLVSSCRSYPADPESSMRLLRLLLPSSGERPKTQCPCSKGSRIKSRRRRKRIREGIGIEKRQEKTNLLRCAVALLSCLLGERDGESDESLRMARGFVCCVRACVRAVFCVPVCFSAGGALWAVGSVLVLAVAGRL